MHLPVSKPSALCLAALAGLSLLLPTQRAAAEILFTGDPEFLTSTHGVPGPTLHTGTGTLMFGTFPQPDLEITDDGFRFTNTEVVYIASAGDLITGFEIRWIIQRPFTVTNGPIAAVTKARIDGSFLATDGGLATDIRMLFQNTLVDGIGVPSLVSAGIAPPPPASFDSGLQVSSPFVLQNGPDKLEQRGRLSGMPSVAGAVYRWDFTNSVYSGVVPAPGVLALPAIGSLVTPRRRRRFPCGGG